MPHQLRPLSARVAERFAECAVWRGAGQQIIDPRLELLHDGLRLPLAQRLGLGQRQNFPTRRMTGSSPPQVAVRQSRPTLVRRTNLCLGPDLR